MKKNPNNGSPSRGGGISYQSLLIAVISFVIGATVSVIFTKILGSGQVTFSITGIITFLFGIALASASIVLAIAAITLGRTSERTMVERSDESIRLQNEVFVKTTDALARIESSTGVTEKRIEDIIAGRAGAIAERLVEHRRIGYRNREEIEKDIRESMLKELPVVSSSKQPSIKDQELEANKLKEANEEYDTFKQQVLFHVSDFPKTKTRKMGDGSFGSFGHDLADAVYETPTGCFAVCTFSIKPIFGDKFGIEGSFRKFIDSILSELSSGTFQQMILVFDGKLDEDNKFTKQIENSRVIAKDELFSRIRFIDGELNEVLKNLSSEFAEEA